jgi:hypothetical protein
MAGVAVNWLRSAVTSAVASMRSVTRGISASMARRRIRYPSGRPSSS